MIIEKFDIYTYALPLKKPISIKGKDLHTRQGIIIHLQASGHEGFGDIAPLENFSQESYEKALEQTKKLQKQILHDEIPPHIEKLDGKLDKYLKKYSLLPSVQFGVESAILNLTASIKKIPLYKLISSSFYEDVAVSGLLQGAKDQVLKDAKTMIEGGYTSLKLKVGGAVKEDIDKVLSLTAVINGKALLHLDANQSWDLDTAIFFSDQIGLSCVEYIEEPLKDIGSISTFFNQTMIPVALDETLKKNSFTDIKSFDGVDFIILKPTILGGIDKIFSIIKQANALAIRTIISSSFETGVGIRILANLAGCTQRDNHAGLDTIKFFESDVVKKPIVMNHGKINIRDLALSNNDIDFLKLTKVS